MDSPVHKETIPLETEQIKADSCLSITYSDAILNCFVGEKFILIEKFSKLFEALRRECTIECTYVRLYIVLPAAH